MIKVSIIIPVYNNSKSIQKTLKNISDQTYSKELVELIVVDNDSTDGICEIIKSYDNILYLTEKNYPNSPYSARNRGIEVAKGEVIVLLDATCHPVNTWLEEGIKCMKESKADIVGGDVRFDLGEYITASKIYDSLTNVKMRESITGRGVAKTGNLFIKKDIFDRVGLFPEGIRSGGDVRWTKQATNNGVNLKFCKDAFVLYKARPFFKLIKKQWRVGKAQPVIWKEQNIKRNYFKALITMLIPPKRKNIYKLIDNRGEEWMKSYTFRLMFVSYCVKIVMGIANCYGAYLARSKKDK